MRTAALFAPLVIASALFGCSGANEKPDNAAWETRKGFRSLGVDDEGEIDISRNMGYMGFDWVGVRHDLALNPDRKQKATCSCLAVEIGSP